MSHQRIKEEERIEKIIRGLLKLPENKRCINCNLLGPQYVCTTFWTFVCTHCSGVHREFTHRVKSVSMAKFNAEEVSCLQAGGNERAREIYFKTWDPQHNSLPDSSNLPRLRDFIKHVYIERKFSGERTMDRLAMVKTDFKDGFYEKRSYDTYGSGSFDRSNPRGPYEPRNLRNFLEDMSPRYKGHASPGNRHRPTAHFEIVDDRFREDGSGNVRRYESHRYASAEHRRGSLLPDPRKNRVITIPEVRPVKGILGDTHPVLKVGEAIKEKGRGPGNLQAEEIAPSNTPGPAGRKEVEQKKEKSSSLIDFNAKANPEPVCPHVSATPKTQEITPSADREDPSSLPQPQQTALEKASPKPNSVEFLLLELAAPVDVPVGSKPEIPSSVDGSSAIPPASPKTANSSETTLNMGNIHELPCNSGDSSSEVSNGQHHLSTQQHHPCVSPTIDSSSTAQLSSPATESSSNQLSCPSPAPDSQAQASSNQLTCTSPSQNSQGQDSSAQHSGPSPVSNNQGRTSSDQLSCPSPTPTPQQDPNSQPTSTSQPAANFQPTPSSPASTSNAATEQSSQVASKQSEETSSADAPKPSGRKELPADIFTALYPSQPAPVPYGQFRPPHVMGMGIGIGMQYNPSAVQVPLPSCTSKSTNPFDLGDDMPQAQNPMFPSVMSLQGAHPHLPAQMAIQPQPSPYALNLLHQQSPPYGMVIPPGTHLGHQPSSATQVPRPQESSNLNSAESAFAALNPLQSQSRFQPPTTTNYSSPTTRGNPFG